MEGTILNNNSDHLALIMSMCLGVHNVISSSYPKLINRSDYYPFTELSWEMFKVTHLVYLPP